MDVDTETAADLVRSRIRVEILAALRAGAATKYELRERLDCSRTTVDRNLEHLQEAGWIEQAPGGYELTTCGEIVVEQATAYLETVTAAKRLQPILRWLPRDELDIDVRHFADAELTIADEVTPMAVVDRHVQRITETTDMRTLLPLTSTQPIEMQYRVMQQREVRAEHLVTPAVAEVYRADEQFSETLQEMLESDGFEIYVTEEPITYYLGILDDVVQIGVDEDGDPRGLLETDDEAVYEWATGKIDRYQSSAVPFAAWE